MLLWKSGWRSFFAYWLKIHVDVRCQVSTCFIEGLLQSRFYTIVGDVRQEDYTQMKLYDIHRRTYNSRSRAPVSCARCAAWARAAAATSTSSRAGPRASGSAVAAPRASWTTAPTLTRTRSKPWSSVSLITALLTFCNCVDIKDKLHESVSTVGHAKTPDNPIASVEQHRHRSVVDGCVAMVNGDVQFY